MQMCFYKFNCSYGIIIKNKAINKIKSKINSILNK